MLAQHPDGWTMFDDPEKSSPTWTNIVVEKDGRKWQFGWNKTRLSTCKDINFIRRHHPSVYRWIVETFSPV